MLLYGDFEFVVEQHNVFEVDMSELIFFFFFFSSRRRHTRFDCDWSSDVCSSDLLAITEHLSFAYALSGKREYGEAARQWVLASCRTWQHEADNAVDGGKAYAVTRLLKGVAVGYDLVYDRFSDAERKEIRETLARIGQLYFKDYFQKLPSSGPTVHTHHA